MKRILPSLLVIFAVAMASIAATSAYFSSSKKASGSHFSVGTLELSVGDGNGGSIEPILIENIGDGSVVSGNKTWTVTNKGSLPGRLYFNLANISNSENGCNSPEAEVDSTCGNPGQTEGELGKIIEVKVYLNDQLVTTTNLDEINKNKISADWGNLSPVILTANQSSTVKLQWGLSSENYGNEIQSDSLGFDVDFNLMQTN